MFRFKTIIVFLLLLSFISCDQIKSTKIIRLGHGLNTGHSVHQGMIFFGEKLQEISGGKLRCKFIPANNWEQNVSVWSCFKLVVWI